MQQGQTGGNAVAYKRVEMVFDTADQLDQILRYASSGTGDFVATSSFAYDGAARLSALTHAQGTNVLADYAWTYDADSWAHTFSNSANIASYAAENVTYSYDNNGQLTGADRSGTANDESYASTLRHQRHPA